MATKEFCDCCGDEIVECQWWTLAGFEMLCQRCYQRLKAEGK